MWGHLDRYPPRPVVVVEERPGTLGGGLSVVDVRGEAAPVTTGPGRCRCGSFCTGKSHKNEFCSPQSASPSSHKRRDKGRGGGLGR